MNLELTMKRPDPPRWPRTALAAFAAAVVAASAAACSRSQAASPPAAANRPTVAVARAARGDL